MASFSTLLVLAFGGHLLPSGWSARRHPFGQSSPRWWAPAWSISCKDFADYLLFVSRKAGPSLTWFLGERKRDWLQKPKTSSGSFWSRGFTSKGPLPAASSCLASSSRGHGGACWLQGFLCRGGCQWLDAIHLRRLHLWAPAVLLVVSRSASLQHVKPRLFSNQYDCFR